MGLPFRKRAICRTNQRQRINQGQRFLSMSVPCMCTVVRVRPLPCTANAWREGWWLRAVGVAACLGLSVSSQRL